MVSASATVSTRSTAPGHLAHGADDLRVAGMPDQQHGATGLLVALDLAVNLGDQGAGGVGEEQPPAPGFGRHGLGHAVGREDHQPVIGHLVQLLDEHGTQRPQLIHHVAVVHDLVADIDRRAIPAQRLRPCRSPARPRREPRGPASRIVSGFLASVM